MSLTLTITGNKSIIHSDYIPALNLDDGNYECGLKYFSVFNSIPNITNKNNVFSYGINNNPVIIPNGVYDLEDLNEYLQNKLSTCRFQIVPNNNTLSCSLFCTQTINFDIENTIGTLLGFPNVKLEANKWHESSLPINILPVAVIRIECDLIKGSYTNGVPTHSIYDFVTNVPPGHRFLEVPNNITYFPISKKYIPTVTINIVDLEGNCIDFRNEVINLSLHIRKQQ